LKLAKNSENNRPYHRQQTTTPSLINQAFLLVSRVVGLVIG